MTSDPRSILDEILHSLGQEHLLAYTQGDREIFSLTKDLQSLDLRLFFELQKKVDEKEEREVTYHPPEVIAAEELPYPLDQFGCIILAGGQASRLRLKGPKGCVSVTPFSQKSLFQLHIDKIKAVATREGISIPIAIMTSPGNRADTELFFQQHGFFGLNPSQISFFSQGVWPLLNFDGNLVLSAPGKLALGPNGNGDVYYQFVKSGIWDRWNSQGIRHVRLMSVDNPLALPVDDALFATHVAHNNEITIQGIEKLEGEHAGTLALKNGKIGVLEYGEFAGPGKYANCGLYLFSMPFIKRVSEITLPIHKVKKAIKTIETEIPSSPNAWKFETFIFDAFEHSKKSELLIYPRKNCFAPLKNFKGEGSITSVQAALLANNREIWKQVVGTPLPENAEFELGASFYYPTEEQRLKWKGKSFPNQKIIEEL